MSRDEEFFILVRARTAPMALIPEDVVKAVEKRSRFEQKTERIMKATVKACLLLLLVGLAVAVMDWGRCFSPELATGLLVSIIGLVSLVLLPASLWWVFRDPRNIDHQQLPNTACSLSAFADLFLPLLDAFGEDGKQMGDYDRRGIEIYARAILYEHARKAKLAQDQDPGNPIAGITEKQEFLRLHQIFSFWDLNPGPFGPYFA